jgi:hypothetical protein
MNKYFTISLILVITILLSACAPSIGIIQTALAQTQAAWSPIPTQTTFPTYTVPPTVAVEVTRIVIVTATYTYTPLYTPTNTSTPTNTFTPTKTPNATQTSQAQLSAMLQADKGDGFYLVNVDIASGIWRSTGKGDTCYWEITTRTGDIISNFLGLAGGTAYVPSTAFQVQFNRCGTWVFLSAS